MASTAGDVDRGEIRRAMRRVSCIAPVDLDLVAGLIRDERGGHHPAEEALLGQVAIEPIAAGAGLAHKDQPSALGVDPADELVDVGLAGPGGTEVEHLGVLRIGNIGNRDGLLYGHPDRRTVC